jgi:hypothetical protein
MQVFLSSSLWGRWLACYITNPKKLEVSFHSRVSYLLNIYVFIPLHERGFMCARERENKSEEKENFFLSPSASVERKEK